MKKNLTDLVLILDESGSMHGTESDVVKGTNALLDSQRSKDEETLITLVLFNDKVKRVFFRKNLNEISNLQNNMYKPSGCTALYDAIGQTVDSLRKTVDELDEINKPENVIFSIMTDGLENASKEYSQALVKEMIEHQKTEGWEFIFQAANIDTVETARSIGISEEDSVPFETSKDGMAKVFRVMGTAIDRKKKK